MLVGEFPKRDTVNVRYPKDWFYSMVNRERMLLFFAEIALEAISAAVLNGLA